MAGHVHCCKTLDATSIIIKVTTLICRTKILVLFILKEKSLVAIYFYNRYIPMALWRTAVTPVCYQWSYCSLALSHWFYVLFNFVLLFVCEALVNVKALKNTLDVYLLTWSVKMVNQSSTYTTNQWTNQSFNQSTDPFLQNERNSWINHQGNEILLQFIWVTSRK